MKGLNMRRPRLLYQTFLVGKEMLHSSYRHCFHTEVRKALQICLLAQHGTTVFRAEGQWMPHSGFRHVLYHFLKVMKPWERSWFRVSDKKFSILYHSPGATNIEKLHNEARLGYWLSFYVISYLLYCFSFRSGSLLGGFHIIQFEDFL